MNFHGGRLDVFKVVALQTNINSFKKKYEAKPKIF